MSIEGTRELEANGAAATAPAPSPEVDPDVLADFVAESLEHAERAEAALLSLERDTSDESAIHVVFRAFHTVKGTSSFLDLPEITALAHCAEELFDCFRRGEARCSGPAADVSLRAVDLLIDMLHAVQRAAGGDPLVYPPRYGDVLRALKAAASGSVPRLGDLLVQEGAIDRATVEAAIAASPGKPIGEALVEAGAVSVGDVSRALVQQQRAVEAVGASVRVRLERLDRLGTLLGELVGIGADVRSEGAVPPALLGRVQRCEAIVRELEDLAASLLTSPLDSVFQTLRRSVRDAARRSGKEIEFRTLGEDLEMERGLVEVLTDCLLHMVRNAIDHGIEPASERQCRGKPLPGVLQLCAAAEGDEVVVSLADDGRGLDCAELHRRAVLRGVVEADRPVTDQDAAEFIFLPGLSTAVRVTELSGRGVGMDVVRRSLERVGGRIEVSSEAGVGTRFVLHLPARAGRRVKRPSPSRL